LHISCTAAARAGQNSGRTCRISPESAAVEVTNLLSASSSLLDSVMHFFMASIHTYDWMEIWLWKSTRSFSQRRMRMQLSSVGMESLSFVSGHSISVSSLASYSSDRCASMEVSTRAMTRKLKWLEMRISSMIMSFSTYCA